MPNNPGIIPPSFRPGQELRASDLKKITDMLARRIIGGKGIDVKTFGNQVVIAKSGEAMRTTDADGAYARYKADMYFNVTWGTYYCYFFVRATSLFVFENGKPMSFPMIAYDRSYILYGYRSNLMTVYRVGQEQDYPYEQYFYAKSINNLNKIVMPLSAINICYIRDITYEDPLRTAFAPTSGRGPLTLVITRNSDGQAFETLSTSITLTEDAYGGTFNAGYPWLIFRRPFTANTRYTIGTEVVTGDIAYRADNTGNSGSGINSEDSTITWTNLGTPGEGDALELV